MTLRNSSKLLLDPRVELGGDSVTVIPVDLTPKSPEQPKGSELQPQPVDGTTQSDADKMAAAIAKDAANTPAPKKEGKVVKPILGGKPTDKVLSIDFTTDEDAPTELKDGEVKDDKTKPATETKPVADKPAEVKPVAAATKQDTKPTARDYTGFTGDEVAILKQMSNPAFEFATKHMKELKELRQQKPDSIYQHPDAYTLTPEYKSAQEDLKFTSFEERHWRQQLVNIRGGKPWQGLDGYNEKGEPVYSGPFKPSDEAEIDVNNAMLHATNVLGQKRCELAALQKTFKDKVAVSDNNILMERTNRFGWVKEPKMLDEVVEIPKLGAVPIKKLREDMKALFPSYKRSSQEVELIADMFVALQIYAARNRELEAGLQTERKLKEDTIRGEPSGGANGDGKGKTKDEFVFDDNIE